MACAAAGALLLAVAMTGRMSGRTNGRMSGHLGDGRAQRLRRPASRAFGDAGRMNRRNF
jgi:hypothetical protein